MDLFCNCVVVFVAKCFNHKYHICTKIVCPRSISIVFTNINKNMHKHTGWGWIKFGSFVIHKQVAVIVICRNGSQQFFDINLNLKISLMLFCFYTKQKIIYDLKSFLEPWCSAGSSYSDIIFRELSHCMAQPNLTLPSSILATFFSWLSWYTQLS